MSASLDARRASWSRYWRSGALHSCTTSFAGNYSGEVAAFWRAACAGLPDGARIVDLATGNGALPRLLQQQAPAGVQWQIDGYDLAELGAVAVPAGIRLHGGVAIETLPLAAAEVDLVVSQFGVEYSELAATVAEIRRVRRPGGRVALVVHADDSLIVEQARAELADLDWLQHEADALALTAGILEPLARAASAEGRARLRDDADAAARRQAFNALIQAIGERLETSRCPDLLDETRAALADACQRSAASGRVAAGQARLDALAELFADRRLQLDELCRAARDGAAARALAHALGGADDAVEPLAFAGGEKLGWGIRVTR